MALGLLCAHLSGAHPASSSAEQSYQVARRAYYALKADPQKRKFRHHWLKVIRRFEAVAALHPKSERAPDALFTSADLLQNLSRLSQLDEDLRSAVADYERLIEIAPSHRLSDDAALALGRIYVERLDEPEKAQKVLTQALSNNPKGDRAREVRSLLASIATERRPPRAVQASPPGSSLQEAIAKATGGPRTGPDPLPALPAPDAGSSGIAAAAEPIEDPAPKAKPATADDRAARSRLKALRSARGQSITLAEQLGLKVRRVVIDPGHGGHDSGAVGASGTMEKDVALGVSLKLKEILSAAGLEVVLTRSDDTFVRLEDRAKAANEAKGDLFLSIHCNSAPSRSMHGIETYTLNTSSDRYSIRLAARENAASEKGISDLQFILADLATKANTEESSRLAARVQHNLVGHLRAQYRKVRDLGTKEALFYVLLGAKMPAILVETSFLSHPEEEARLKSAEYQQKLAEAIAAGVEDFLGNRQRLAKVD